MTQPWSDYMRVGLVHFMAYPAVMGGEGPVLETIEPLLQDPFFDVIEVTHVRDDALPEKLAALFEQAGVEPCFGAQPILLGNKLDLNHSQLEDRGKAVAAVKRGLDQAARMGCRAASVMSGPVREDKAAAREQLVESLTELTAYAKAKGMTLALETFDQAPFAKNCLIGPTAEAVDVAKLVRGEHPDFGLLLDLSHLPLLNEESGEALKMAREYLTHAHIGNCAMDDPDHPAYGDNHPRFGAVGTRVGVDELAKYLQALVDIGYLSRGKRGIVSFEVKPMPGESSEAIIAGSKRALMAAWRQVNV